MFELSRAFTPWMFSIFQSTEVALSTVGDDTTSVRIWTHGHSQAHIFCARKGGNFAQASDSTLIHCMIFALSLMYTCVVLQCVWGQGHVMYDMY